MKFHDNTYSKQPIEGYRILPTYVGSNMNNLWKGKRSRFGFNHGRGKDAFSCWCVPTGSTAYPAPTQWSSGAISLEVKGPKREVLHTVRSYAAVKNDWS